MGNTNRYRGFLVNVGADGAVIHAEASLQPGESIVSISPAMTVGDGTPGGSRFPVQWLVVAVRDE